MGERHRESYEQLYNSLMSAIPLSVLIIDRQLQIVAVNSNFLQKTGRGAETTVGQPLHAVLPPVILEGTPLVQTLRRVLQTQQPVRGEHLSYRAPGVPLCIYYYSIIPVIRGRNSEHVILLMEDVTEQLKLSEEIRRIERHLATIVESASDIIVATDSAGCILTWNSAGEHSTHWTFNELQGTPLYKLFTREHWRSVKRIFESEMELEALGHPEWELLTKEGQEVPVSWAFSALKADQGTVGLAGIGRDLTERRKLEAQVIQSQKLAALGVMAGGIAHEIRNPLTVCSSAAQFLMEEDLNAQFVRECAEQIRDSCQRASFIIESLLSFARPSVTKKVESVDLVAIVGHTLSLMGNEAKLNKIQMETNVPARSLGVMGNANMLQQMLMNLIMNAFKAMPDGGTMDVTVRQDGSDAVIVVKDTGCGIEQEHIENIFDPFYTTSPVGEGSGLGLSLCYYIASQHSGSIKVQSTPGKGAAFTIRLPATADEGE